jgi:hypothetical protein
MKERNERKKLARACIFEDEQKCSSSSSAGSSMTLASTSVVVNGFNYNLSNVETVAVSQVVPEVNSLFTILEEDDSECCTNVKIMCDNALLSENNGPLRRASLAMSECTEESGKSIFETCSKPPLLKKTTSSKKKNKSSCTPPLPEIITFIAADDVIHADNGEGIDMKAVNESCEQNTLHPDSSGIHCLDGIDDATITHHDTHSATQGKSIPSDRSRRRIDSRPYEQIEKNHANSRLLQQQQQQQQSHILSWDELAAELEACKLISIVDLNRSVHSNNDFGHNYYHQQEEEEEDHKNTMPSRNNHNVKDDNDVSWDELGDAINKGCMKSLLDVSLQVVQTQQQIEAIQNGTSAKEVE